MKITFEWPAPDGHIWSDTLNLIGTTVPLKIGDYGWSAKIINVEPAPAGGNQY